MTQVINPYDGSVIATVAEHDEDDVRSAISRAVAVAPKMKAMPAHRRASILTRTAELLEANINDIASIMAKESGKPLKYARGEVNRAVETFTFAADAARSMHGETIPMDAAKGGVGKIGYFVREPVGVLAAITPFNFPLNLVAHKVAPAIAAGCPIVLKPAPATPLTSLRLAELMIEAGLPEGAFEVVLGDRAVGEWLTSDPRIAMITFTGSPAVARIISNVVGLRRATYELGGNAAVIIESDADIDKAVGKCVVGGFAYSGQVCISVQRIYVHESKYDAFRDSFIQKTQNLSEGDPLSENTDIGPMINDHATNRVDAWVDEAVQQGARVLYRGQRKERILPPIVLDQVTTDMRVLKDEVFGPVVCLVPYSNFDDALNMVNDSEFGLQAGVFTADIGKAMRAAEQLNVGGVIINDVPTFRIDNMPYGGNKNSGVGREGPRFAIEEMTTLKAVVLTL